MCAADLNVNWDTERDGGCLRAYLPGGGGTYRDVAPTAGRLLLFDPCTVVHEVRPTYAARYAITLWASKAKELEGDVLRGVGYTEPAPLPQAPLGSAAGGEAGDHQEDEEAWFNEEMEGIEVD